MGEQLFWYKFGMLFGILGSSVVMSFLPFALKNVDPVIRKKLMSFGNSFAGGVFLSIGFIHLLAEADELMHEAVPSVEFPLAFLLCMIGFLGVFFIEKVVFADSHSHNHNHNHHVRLTEEEPIDTKHTQKKQYGSLDVEHNSHEHKHEEESKGEHYAANESSVFAYIITLVLSIHSLISGVALGMEQSLTTLIPLFVGIIGHKWIEAFALGVALNKVNDSLKENWKLLVWYSAMEPLGILIGEVLSLYLPESALIVVQAFVISFASGTFIYVAVMDILPTEFGIEDTHDKYKKFFIFFVGFGAVALLMMMFDHDHEGGHDIE